MNKITYIIVASSSSQVSEQPTVLLASPDTFSSPSPSAPSQGFEGPPLLSDEEDLHWFDAPSSAQANGFFPLDDDQLIQ